MKDKNRKGETVKPFNEQESWDLLVKLLGDKWTEAEKSGQLKPADKLATREWVRKLEGLRESLFAGVTELTSNIILSSFNIDSGQANYKS
jgi:hypothetical protein